MLSIVLVLLLGIFAAGGDQGSGIDPNGSAVRAARCADEGSGLDPHGRPCTTRSLDSDDGNGLDPHG